jgi:hypothetical protein
LSVFVGENHRHSIVDRSRDAIRRGFAREHRHALYPILAEARSGPKRREREQPTAVDLKEERLAGLAVPLGFQPLEIAVGDLKSGEMPSE